MLNTYTALNPKLRSNKPSDIAVIVMRCVKILFTFQFSSYMRFCLLYVLKRPETFYAFVSNRFVEILEPLSIVRYPLLIPMRVHSQCDLMTNLSSLLCGLVEYFLSLVQISGFFFNIKTNK